MTKEEMLDQFWKYLKELDRRGATEKELNQLLERFHYSDKSRNKVFYQVKKMVEWQR